MQTDAEKQFNMHKLHFCWQLENKTLHAEKLGRVETKSNVLHLKGRKTLKIESKSIWKILEKFSPSLIREETF